MENVDRQKEREREREKNVCSRHNTASSCVPLKQTWAKSLLNIERCTETKPRDGWKKIAETFPELVLWQDSESWKTASAI